MSVQWQKTYYFTLDLGNKIHSLNNIDTLKIAFTDSNPATLNAGAGPHVYADISSPLSLTNMATSPALTSVTWTQSLGISILGAATWTGTSQTGDFGPFRYIVIYNDSAANKNVIAWADYGSELTLHGANADQIVITFPSGILTNG